MASMIPGEVAEAIRKTLRKDMEPLKSEFKICHISDIHIGAFYYNRDDVADSKGQYRILARTADFIRTSKLKPRFLFITGDIVSKAHQERPLYGQFKEFIENLDKPDPYQETLHQVRSRDVIVVPGNHDVAWPPGEDGTLHAFREEFQNWNTPFSPPEDSFRYPFLDEATGCQGCVYCYPDCGLIVAALDSCQFSGGKRDELKKLWERVANLSDAAKADQGVLQKLLEEIVHVDNGYLPISYARRTTTVLRYVLKEHGGERTSWFICAMVHHNLIGDFPLRKIVVDQDAWGAYKILGGNGGEENDSLAVDCIFHGHVHVKGSPTNVTGTPSIVCAPTLGGIDRPEALGLNVLEVGPAWRGEHRTRTLRRYELGATSFVETKDSPVPLPVA